MTDDEAIEICYQWFAHIAREEERTKKMQELAVLARTDQPEAQRQLRQLDRQPSVFDGARLLPAVQHLVERIR